MPAPKAVTSHRHRPECPYPTCEGLGAGSAAQRAALDGDTNAAPFLSPCQFVGLRAQLVQPQALKRKKGAT